jgi:hypothetical protein
LLTHKYKAGVIFLDRNKHSCFTVATLARKNSFVTLTTMVMLEKVFTLSIMLEESQAKYPAINYHLPTNIRLGLIFLDRNKHSFLLCCCCNDKEKQFCNTNNYDHVSKSFYFVHHARGKSGKITCH